MNIFKYCALSVAISLQATFNFTNEHLDQVKNFAPRERSVFIFSCMHMDKHDSGSAVSYTPAYLLDGALTEAGKIYEEAKKHGMNSEENINETLKVCAFPIIQHFGLPIEIWDLEFSWRMSEKNIGMSNIAILISHCFDIHVHLNDLELSDHNNLTMNTLHFVNQAHKNLSIDYFCIGNRRLYDKFLETKKSLSCTCLDVCINYNLPTSEIEKQKQDILSVTSQICTDKLSLLTIYSNVDISDICKDDPKFINMIEANTKLPLQQGINTQLAFHKSIFDFSGISEKIMALPSNEKTLFIFECLYLHEKSQRAYYYTKDNYTLNPYDDIFTQAWDAMCKLNTPCSYFIKNNAFKILQHSNMPKEMWDSEFSSYMSMEYKRNDHYITRLAAEASKVKLKIELGYIEFDEYSLNGRNDSERVEPILNSSIGDLIHSNILSVKLIRGKLKDYFKILGTCSFKRLVIELNDRNMENPCELSDDEYDFLVRIIEEQIYKYNSYLQYVIILSESKNKYKCDLSNTKFRRMMYSKNFTIKEDFMHSNSLYFHNINKGDCNIWDQNDHTLCNYSRILR